MENNVKLSNLVKKNCKTKEYLHSIYLHFVRELYIIHTNMNKVHGNYKSDPIMVKNGVGCMACSYKKEVNSHIECEGYRDLRMGKDLGVDSILMEYFREVMNRRREIKMKKLVGFEVTQLFRKTRQFI